MTRRPMMASAIALSLALLALVSACSGKQQAKKIVFASDATWPPMEYLDESKNVVGFDVDVANAIARVLGIEITVRNTAWDGIFAGLGNGQYDAVISSVTITEERKQTMDFSDPYVNAGQVIIVRSGTEGIATLADLAGKTAGAQIGTTGAGEITKAANITLKSYDELGLAIEDLANGRIDAVICDTPIAADYVLKREEYREKLKIVGDPFTEEFYGIAVAKGNTELLARINEALKAIRESGELKALEDKWLR